MLSNPFYLSLLDAIYSLNNLYIVDLKVAFFPCIAFINHYAIY
jgi:hypothetical protein